jgi:hypothetical protein
MQLRLLLAVVLQVVELMDLAILLLAVEDPAQSFCISKIQLHILFLFNVL